MEKMLLPVGIEDFKTVVNQCYYVDKSELLERVMDSPDGTVQLFTRPRRFGKTVVLSMIDYFFSDRHKDEKALFSNLKIGARLKEQGKYPLIHLNLKSLNGGNFADMLSALSLFIRDLCLENRFLLESEILLAEEKKDFQSLLDGEKDPHKLAVSLYKLTEWLNKSKNKRVILLIDEYDSPLLRAKEYGYYEEAILFFRSFYGNSLKGNGNLKWAMVTGVVQIAKESLFSDLNNLIVDNVIDGSYSEYFGFTEKEVKALLSYYSLEDSYPLVKEWYDGYRIGESMVYNPWSIINFAKNGGKFKPYWLSTGENSLFSSLLFSNENAESWLLSLLKDKEVYDSIDPSLNFAEIERKEALPSYLLATGYLTIKEQCSDGNYLLSIPNKEVATAFQKEVIGRLYSSSNPTWALSLKKAINDGDVDNIKNILEEYIVSVLSYYDFPIEKNYQCLLLGVCATLFFDYEVKSEVNAGLGRCDILILPHSHHKKAIIIELKAFRSKQSKAKFEKAAEVALRQIKEKEYENDIKKKGYKEILSYGIAFYKNKVTVVSESLSF